MNLFNRAKQIIIAPKTERTVIASEEADVNALTFGYFIPLAMIPAIASFIGYGLIGFSIPFLNMFVRGIDIGLYRALESFIGLVVVVFVNAIIHCHGQIECLAHRLAKRQQVYPENCKPVRRLRLFRAICEG